MPYFMDARGNWAAYGQWRLLSGWKRNLKELVRVQRKSWRTHHMEHGVIRSSTRLLQYAALLYSISSYRCRGTVWAVPPDARGKIFDTKKNRYVVTEVSLNTVDENAIKNRILHAVWDLWTSHAEAIYRAMYGTFARAAADITPQIAAQLYAEQYPMLGYPTLENPAQ